MTRDKVYFASDVHLGLKDPDPAEREARFLSFLHRINNPRTEALCLLGDVWDFWFEWKYTVPKGYVRVLHAILELMDAGIKVYFVSGNHDIWTYNYFRDLGMIRIEQPAIVEMGGKKFLLGHGDGLGPTPWHYMLMKWCFRNKVIQTVFGAIVHPTIIMALGNYWSTKNRVNRPVYKWKGKKESLVIYSEQVLKEHPDIDYFIYGHLHVAAQETLSTGAKLYVMDAWLFQDSELEITLTD